MFNNFQSQRLDTRSVVFYLIATNVALFVLTYLAPELGFKLALFYPASEHFMPWQIITHMFMHAGIAHIFFNMFNLYMFGTVLERVWGQKRFLEFYSITGLGAMALHTFVQGLEIYRLTGSFFPSSIDAMTNSRVMDIMNTPTVGASGAIFGLLTAFGMLFANTDLYIYGAIPVKAKYLVTGLILWELYRGFAYNPSDNVAHFAHLGGALIGFIMVKVWNRNRDYLF